jgi:glycosyltransferase involved in cell wall biosynthesis
VEFETVGSYTGMTGLIRSANRIDRLGRAHVRPGTAILLRVPSPIAFRIGNQAIRSKHKYCVEVVGDPDQVFARGVIDHPIRPLLRFGATRAQRRLCRRAAAALYVTERILQAKYPTCGQAFAASDVELSAGILETAVTERNAVPVLVTVAALDRPYKGIHVLLQAVALLRERGLMVRLRVVGGGCLKESLEATAQSLGLEDQVTFTGQVPSSAVTSELDSADVFVLPSLTEGLPRALLEAMARGLPAIGSAIGGIPELLPEECLAAAGDATGLAERIGALVSNDRFRRAAAEANVRRAADFAASRLSCIRREFLHCVKTGAATASMVH